MLELEFETFLGGAELGGDHLIGLAEKDQQCRIDLGKGWQGYAFPVAKAVVIELEREFVTGIGGTGPAELLEAGLYLAVAGRVEYGVVLVPGFPRAQIETELDMPLVVVGRDVVAAEIEQGEPEAVTALEGQAVGFLDIGLEAVVQPPAHTQPVLHGADATGYAAEQLAHVLVARGGKQVGTGRLAGIQGDDVDGTEKGVGAVGGGVGSAYHLDALHVLDVQRQVGPAYATDGGAVDRAPVHQYLHATRVFVGEAVIGGGYRVSAGMGNLESRHQSQQVGDVEGTAGVDHGAVDHGHGHRRTVLGLGQAGGGQYHGVTGQVVVLLGEAGQSQGVGRQRWRYQQAGGRHQAAQGRCHGSLSSVESVVHYVHGPFPGVRPCPCRRCSTMSADTGMPVPEVPICGFCPGASKSCRGTAVSAPAGLAVH